jgi:hypothetical protein
MMGALGRLPRWLQRTIDADERYICAACDDRFAGRSDGIAHVLDCHPEFAGIFSQEISGNQLMPVAEPSRPRSVGATRPLVAAAGWS